MRLIHTLSKTLAETARGFLRDRSGNFGLMLAVVTPVLLLGSGYGLNVAQMVNAKSTLLNALDSAVTSTARDLTTGAIQEEDARAAVEAFLFTNGAGGFVEAGQLTLDSLEVDKANSTVSARASVVIDVVFPVFGIENRQRITTASAALYSNKKIEVAMMLDVTGSMEKKGKDDKLGDLQNAATNAIRTLLGSQDPNDPRVRIALVPYANSVNVGSSIARQAVYVERKASERTQAPANTDPKAASGGVSRPDNCATERKGKYSLTDDGPGASMVNRDYLLDEFAGGYRVYAASLTCPKAEIVPLTANKKSLDDMVGKFVANGGTGGHIGIQWTWYMLSEKWKNVVGTKAAAAKSDPRKVSKYAILMTDGEFNLGFDGASRVQDVYGNSAAARSIPHAKKLCAAMRKEGIEIFTIGFKLAGEGDARDVMADCASPDTASTRHFFDTADGQELDAAFQEIAYTIERLALTK
jgi:Flp pilus assembly protein TadG